MAHRHKVHKKAKGGRVVYEGAGSHIQHEAESEHSHKRGGKVTHMHGHKGKHRIHKRRGGGVGSDMHPFSSAYSAASEAGSKKK